MRKFFFGLMITLTASLAIAETVGSGGLYGVIESFGGALNGGALSFDADGDSYCQSPSDDLVECWAGGDKVFSWDANNLSTEGEILDLTDTGSTIKMILNVRKTIIVMSLMQPTVN